jgi:hypothetical protein
MSGEDPTMRRILTGETLSADGGWIAAKGY